MGIEASSDPNAYSVTTDRTDHQAFDPTVFQDEFTHLIVANGDVVEIPINIAVKCGEARAALVQWTDISLLLGGRGDQGFLHALNPATGGNALNTNAEVQV